VSEPTVIPPGAGEIIGDAPDRRVEILSEHDALHATWTRFGPRRDGADLHIHHRHTDLFYVLAGELTVRLGARGEETVVRAGTLVRVPPLVVHGFRNGSDAELRYLNMHAPGAGFVDYMRGLRDRRRVAFDQHDPPVDGGRPAAEAAIGDATADVDEIGISETTLEPGAPVPPHVHHRHVESFYVLEGELALTVDGREISAAAGSWLQVPPGAAHSLACREPARFLDLHTPSCGVGTLDQEPAR
jgi:quercetin dioxygenase-like cupin family protein